jgi:tetratricopeptide repeat protein 30
MLDFVCMLDKEDRFEEALAKYTDIRRVHGFILEVTYCMALCNCDSSGFRRLSI